MSDSIRARGDRCASLLFVFASRLRVIIMTRRGRWRSIRRPWGASKWRSTGGATAETSTGTREPATAEASTGTREPATARDWAARSPIEATPGATESRPASSPTALPIEVWTEGTLANLLRGLRSGCALLHDLVDRQRLPEKALPLRRLHGGTTNLSIAHHDDRKALGLTRLRIIHEDCVLDHGKRGKEFTHMLDGDAWIEIPHVDFEHRHETHSQPHLEEPARPQADRSRPPEHRRGSAKRSEPKAYLAWGHGEQRTCRPHAAIEVYTIRTSSPGVLRAFLPEYNTVSNEPNPDESRTSMRQASVRRRVKVLMGSAQPRQTRTARSRRVMQQPELGRMPKL
jgi:hypothetical protein